MRAELLHVLVKTPLGFKIVQLRSCGPERLRNSHMATQCALRQPRADHQCPVGYFLHHICTCLLSLWCNTSSWWHGKPFDYHMASVGAGRSVPATWREMSGHADGFIWFFPPRCINVCRAYHWKRLSSPGWGSDLMFCIHELHKKEMRYLTPLFAFFVKVVAFDLSKEHSTGVKCSSVSSNKERKRAFLFILSLNNYKCGTQ